MQSLEQQIQTNEAIKSLYMEAVMEHVTIKLEKCEDETYYVSSRENVESYIPRWYSAKWHTFGEAVDDFRQIAEEASTGQRPWGTGGLFAGYLSG